MIRKLLSLIGALTIVVAVTAMPLFALAQPPKPIINGQYHRSGVGAAGSAEIRTDAGLCLDVHPREMGNNGGRVRVWACNGQPQQRWTYDQAARAIRVASGLCLDVHAPQIATNGGRVQVWACNASRQQQWAPLETGALRNAGGLCLDVHAPDQASNGGRVQLWQCNGSAQQRFTMMGPTVSSDTPRTSGKIFPSKNAIPRVRAQ